MARPIKATPILYGKAARRFEQRMLEEPKETPEERERRLRDYEMCLRMLEAGKNVKLKTRSDD